MKDLIPLQIPSYATPLQLNKSIGQPGKLMMIKLRQLFVDPSYQRPVMEDGRRNIRKIAEQFNWAYFSALKVAPREGENNWGEPIFAIIDGQHHATGALARGDIEEVPCLVDDTPYEVQASAFATINGGVTKMSPLMLHRARRAAGDGMAHKLDAACQRAGVVILGYPKQDCAVGETMAVNTVRSCFERFGEEILVSALSIVTKTGDGNPTYLREGVIAGACDVFYGNPNWSGEAAVGAMGPKSIKTLYAEAIKAKGDTGKGSIRTHFADGLGRYLRTRLGDGGTREDLLVHSRALGDRTGRRMTGKTHRDPAELKHLATTHPAVLEQRTLFPSTVISPAASERLLISGANSAKLGKQVQKGEWAGFPIYQLSLEERASCPPTCNNRLTCYGNSMPFARRHRNDETLVPVLRKELQALQDLHRRGFVVRLHVLGDFYSLAYVAAWKSFLGEFPALHVFGYTAWSKTNPIGGAINELTARLWSRFAVRFSSDRSEEQGATTIWRKPEAAVVAEGVVCPAQTDATSCCATCGMCWAAGAKAKTIVFVGHGGVGSRSSKVLQDTTTPTKAAKNPKADDASGNVRALTRTDMRRPAMQVTKDRDRVSSEERAMIDAALAKGKVRQFEAGASGDAFNMCDWLSRNGHPVTKTSVRGTPAYIIGNKRHDLAGLQAFFNKIRQKKGHQPITRGVA